MKPKFQNRKWIYKGRKLSLAIETFLYHGKRLPREIIHHPGSVVIIPKLPDGRLLLIRQYRYPCRKELWEFPAGTRDIKKGRVESARSCAVREIQEETGFKANVLKRIGGFFLAPGTSTEFMEVYLADRLTPKRLPCDEDEVIEPQAFSKREIRQMIRTGKIQDAKTVAAFFCFLLE
jgi:ADP-ribose pyrophosphatase